MCKSGPHLVRSPRPPDQMGDAKEPIKRNHEEQRAGPLCHRMWQRPKVREGEVGCLFDEIQDLVGPTERRTMDGLAGPQRGRTPERREESRLWVADAGRVQEHEQPGQPKNSGHPPPGPLGSAGTDRNSSRVGKNYFALPCAFAARAERCPTTWLFHFLAAPNQLRHRRKR